MKTVDYRICWKHLLAKMKSILFVGIFFWIFILFFPLAKEEMIDIGLMVIILFLAEPAPKQDYPGL